MDRKSIIIVVLCLIVLVLWQFVIVPRLATPLPPSTQPQAPPSVTATNVPVGPGIATNVPAGPPSPIAAAAAPRVLVATNAPETLRVVTGDRSRFTFTSHGGGVKYVELLEYLEAAGRAAKDKSGPLATLNADSPSPSLALLDGEALQGDGVYDLTQTEDGVRAEKRLSNGLRIVKEFTPGTNYLLTATVRLENTSTQALSLPEQKWVVGTATPMGMADYSPESTVGWMWHDGNDSKDTLGASYFSDRGFACLPRTPPAAYRAIRTNIVWAAVHNQFFALALMPHEPATDVVAYRVNLPAPAPAELREHPRAVRQPQGYETMLVYPPVTLAPGEVLQQQFAIFAGPKEYQTLARISARFNNGVDAVMGFGWFGIFSKPLLLGMNALHELLKISYGWVIIVITIIIKVLFWPLTAASTRSMKRMQSLQPQMKAIQEKYKDDPTKMQRKMMEFMKQNKVNPMGGCLPMLLQMPVFIGFFYMIRSAIELRGESFLWVADLSRPDTLFFIPGTSFPFNLLPLLMGATMLWQAHLTPPSPGMDPVQQKILRYMPLIFMVFLYNFSAGLTLYWTVQNLLTIVQTKLTRTTAATNPPAKAPVLTPPPKKRK